MVSTEQGLRGQKTRFQRERRPISTAPGPDNGTLLTVAYRSILGYIQYILYIRITYIFGQNRIERCIYRHAAAPDRRRDCVPSPRVSGKRRVDIRSRLLGVVWVSAVVVSLLLITKSRRPNEAFMPAATADTPSSITHPVGHHGRSVRPPPPTRSVGVIHALAGGGNRPTPRLREPRTHCIIIGIVM